MSEALLSFEAFDTLWFREGRPFEQMDDGLAEARAVFPPSPSTLAGAVARLINPNVKDGPDPRLRLMALGDVGARDQIKFAGPFLQDSDMDVFAPAPATLLGRKRRRLEDADAYRHSDRRPENLGLLLPRQDLAFGGVVPFPFVPPGTSGEDRFEPLMSAGGWITLRDLARHMADMTAFHRSAVAHIKPAGLSKLHMGEIFRREQRIGIAVDEWRRTANDGQLFAAQHLRPKEGDAALRLALFASDPGEDAIANLDGEVAAVGGKGRFARVTSSPRTLSESFADVAAEGRPAWRAENGRVCFRLTALTPVPVLHGCNFGLPLPPGGALFEQLKVQTAIMPRRPMPVGVWNSAGKQPARIIQAHPAGTTWFVTTALPSAVQPEQVIAEVLAQRFVPPGMEDLGAMGFGVLAAGEWPTFAQLAERIKKGRN